MHIHTALKNDDYSQLGELDLEGYGVTDIVGFKRYKVQFLYLNCNKIQYIEDFDAEGLFDLLLSENEIESIHRFDVKELKDLGFRENKIKHIEGFNVNNLHELSLKGNQIEYIYDFDPKGLQVCDLSNNPLQYINPRIIGKLKRIPALDQEEFAQFDVDGFKKGVSQEQKIAILSKIRSYKSYCIQE